MGEYRRKRRFCQAGRQQLSACIRVKQSVTGLEWPRGFQEVKVPRFHDNSKGWW